MVRLALLALALLAACGAPPSAEDARAAYDEAVRAGDAYAALAALDARADAGDLGALGDLAHVRSVGHLSPPYERGNAGVLPFLQVPGQAALARWRYARARDARARAGDPEALLAVAEDLGGPGFRWGDGDHLTPADRDTLGALYRRLRDADVRQMSVAFLARELGDEAAYALHVRRAEAAGEPGACWHRIWSTGERPDTATPAGFVAYVDEAESCRPAEDGRDPAADGVRQLASQVRLGNEGAGVFLDSLRARGLFERYPRLAPLADGA